MHEDRPAFDQRLTELTELGVIEFRPEPLDAIVERRLKTIWEERSCPHCGADSLHALNGSDRIWCGRCDCLCVKEQATAVVLDTGEGGVHEQVAPPEFLDHPSKDKLFRVKADAESINDRLAALR